VTVIGPWTPEAIGDLTGATVLVTGANSGIGLRTCAVLAAHKAAVIMAGRSLQALTAAAAVIRQGTPDADLRPLILDLADLDSVRAAAETARAGAIDVLVNNAGVMNLPARTFTKDGFETTFGVNHLGHFAFNALVWPALARARAARVITVSAIAATWPSGKLEDLMSEQKYRPMGAYAKSKRANVVYTIELARRVAAAKLDIVPAVVHPGSAMTGLQRHTGSAFERLLTLLANRLLMGSPEGAAWPSLYTATSADIQPGGFYGPAGRDQTRGAPQLVALPKGADNPAEGARLWEISETLTGVKFPI
jgi:NAD(P)-dependent dehydrogenase (short-subunit alcohol dehydrogenase family)